jgi:hypothetical protein
LKCDGEIAVVHSVNARDEAVADEEHLVERGPASVGCVVGPFDLKEAGDAARSGHRLDHRPADSLVEKPLVVGDDLVAVVAGALVVRAAFTPAGIFGDEGPKRGHVASVQRVMQAYRDRLHGIDHAAHGRPASGRSSVEDFGDLLAFNLSHYP